MSVSLADFSVPLFVRALTNLSNMLDKGAAYAAARKFDPNVLADLRLYPDMFPLKRQVQIACDFAKSVPARLADVEVPSYEDNEKTFEDLHARIAKTLKFIDGIDAGKFDGSEDRGIVLRPGTPRERKFDGGVAYLYSYGIPQFFFHVTTAYALLRHNGVELGKKDYMGEA